MKISKRKIEIAMASSCVDTIELANLAKVGYATIKRAFKDAELKPSTVGKIAKALQVDVTELLED